MDFTDETIRLALNTKTQTATRESRYQTDLNVITRYKTIISDLDLTFSFIASTDFKQIFLFRQKIAPARDVDIHAHVLHLRAKRCVAHRGGLSPSAKFSHHRPEQVCISAGGHQKDHRPLNTLHLQRLIH